MQNISLKTHITLGFMAMAVLISISSCTTVEQREPSTHSTSTTTEHTTLSRPLSSSVETQTVRSY